MAAQEGLLLVLHLMATFVMSLEFCVESGTAVLYRLYTEQRPYGCSSNCQISIRTFRVFPTYSKHVKPGNGKIDVLPKFNF